MKKKFFFLFQIDLLNREWKILFIESFILHVKLCTCRYCSELSCWFFFFVNDTKFMLDSTWLIHFIGSLRNQISRNRRFPACWAEPNYTWSARQNHPGKILCGGLISWPHLVIIGPVLIVIWWLRMEGDCCFSYSFLRSLPINDSILVFHLMALAQICINCKMIFGPTTRGLP